MIHLAPQFGAIDDDTSPLRAKIVAQRGDSSEAEALKQVIDLCLAGHDIRTPFRIDDRAVHQPGVPFSPNLGRRRLEQDLDQLRLQRLGQFDHALDHLSGQVLEVPAPS